MEIRKFIERKAPVIALSLGLGVGGLALAGCSNDPEVLKDRPGTVTEHIYHPPYTSFIMAGKVPIITYHPAEYDLDVRQCDRAADSHADAQGCVTAEIEVSEQTYQQFPDGSQIEFPSK